MTLVVDFYIGWGRFSKKTEEFERVIKLPKI
jgi:hypothetical protein